MFSSLVVPVDLEQLGDRALPFAHRIAAAAHVPVELVTISSPNMSEAADIVELEHRVQALNDVACRFRVVHAEHAVDAIDQFLAARPDALLTMATHARWLLTGRLIGSVSEELLARRVDPTLLVGPRAEWAPTDGAGGAPPLVVGAHPDVDAATVVEAVASWTATLPGTPVWLVEVVTEAGRSEATGGDADRRLRQLAAQLALEGVDAQWRAIQCGDPAAALIQFADRLGDAVLVLGSERWTDPARRRLGSVARRVTHEGRHPVLVAPARAAC